MRNSSRSVGPASLRFYSRTTSAAAASSARTSRYSSSYRVEPTMVGQSLGRYHSNLSLHSSSPSSPSQEEALPAGVPRGLVNFGNTCYMNAVLEALYSAESLRSLVQRAASYDKPLASELADLFRSMKSSPYAVSPANFKRTFTRHSARFSGYSQHDAQEFLRYLVNGVHEELNRAPKSRPARAPREPASAEEAWSQYRAAVDDSPLVELLVGQLCSTIECGLCGGRSRCWDPFWDLSLPLSRARYSCRLADVLQDFCAPETLEYDNRPVCATCKRATAATKQIELCRLPPLIILHLKKFSNDGYKLTSPEVKVDRTLSLGGAGYRLKACISHHGHSASSGHYTSHCEYSGRWYHFNDDRVRDATSSFDGDALKDAYVLIYAESSSHSRL